MPGLLSQQRVDLVNKEDMESRKGECDNVTINVTTGRRRSLTLVNVLGEQTSEFPLNKWNKKIIHFIFSNKT